MKSSWRGVGLNVRIGLKIGANWDGMGSSYICSLITLCNCCFRRSREGACNCMGVLVSEGKEGTSTSACGRHRLSTLPLNMDQEQSQVGQLTLPTKRIHFERLLISPSRSLFSSSNRGQRKMPCPGLSKWCTLIGRNSVAGTGSTISLDLTALVLEEAAFSPFKMIKAESKETQVPKIHAGNKSQSHANQCRLIRPRDDPPVGCLPRRVAVPLTSRRRPLIGRNSAGCWLPVHCFP